MRRRWSTRLGSAFLAIWFVLCVTEPVAAMHRCPMHDGVAGVMAMPNGQAMNGAAPLHQGTDSQPTAPAHHDCTCLGDCAGAAFAGLPAASVSVVAAVVQTVRVDTPVPQIAAPVAAPFARPFANGPPSIA
ncbi:MAG TPA: hypothetical protein VN607_02085 [Gemmatimonadaceae bacterium]|nr:hypothetical protein [Gemmatimonadaceae bacterium]